MLEVKRIPDVSEHQGKIRWEKLKDKIPGAIIRVGYGDDLKSQDDLYAIYNMQECTRLGIPFAVYIYSYAATEKQIRSEIAHTKRVCAGFKPVSYRSLRAQQREAGERIQAYDLDRRLAVHEPRDTSGHQRIR